MNEHVLASTLPETGVTPLERISRWRHWAFLVALLGGAGCLAGALVAPREFAAGYLVAFLFWLGISLGSWALVMIHSLSGGEWGEVLRPALTAALPTIPLMALCFVPVALTVGEVFPWAETNGSAATSNAPPAIAAYLNVEMWQLRAVLYFLLWSVCSLLIYRWSHAGDPALAAHRARLRYRLSGPGLLLFAVSMEFASTDFSMSLDPHWYSSMYGIATMAGQVCSGMAFAICLTTLVVHGEPWQSRITRGQCHDLGSLLFTSITFWTYSEFMQYLIIYSGNLPDEARWYLPRNTGPWLVEARLLALFHFAVPFVLLLFRPIKEDRVRLGQVAGLLVFMQLVEWHWLVIPAHYPDEFVLPWTTVAAVALIGGVWMSLYCQRLAGEIRGRLRIAAEPVARHA